MLLAGAALAAAPNDLDAGIALYNQGKYTDAIARLSTAQSVPTQTARALYYRGLAELKLGRNKTGMDTLRALVADAPASAEAKLAARYLSAATGAAQAPAPHLQDKPGSTANQAEFFHPLPSHIRIPYTEGRDGWMHVKATIKGNQTVDMVWDTGASNCSIPTNIYGRIPPDAKQTLVETPAGKEPAYITRIQIEVAGLKRSAITTLMPGTAVIGQSFFQDYEVEVNRKEHALYLDYVTAGGAASRPKTEPPTPDSSLIATADGAVRRVVHRLPPHPQIPPKPHHSLPFERESNLLLIDILVDNHPVKAYFDTGCAAQGIAMTAAMAASARDRLVRKVNKQIEHQKIVDLTLGPIELQNVKVTIANGLSRPLVGPAILGKRGYRINPASKVIDFDLVED